MRLLYKLLLGYFLIIIIVSVFFAGILIYIVKENSENLSVYREREITSFVKVLNAVIIDGENLKSTSCINNIFNSTIDKLPHLKRLTLHAQDKETLKYIHFASTIPEITGTPSHKEDINAILQNKTTLLYEKTEDGEHLIDITYPVASKNGTIIAAIGIAMSLTESDEILKQEMNSIKENTINAIITAILITIFISLVFTIIVTKKIISPLIRLKKAVKSISKEKKYKNIDIRSNDEIGELTSAFNEMSYKLNSLHSSMEEKIENKTRELQKQFLTDSLTLLPNRQALFNDIAKTKKFCLAILDIASFKNINDSYGIDIGNEILKKLAKNTTQYLKDSKLKLYRLSADEAVVFNPLVQSKEEFKATIEGIIENIEREPFHFKHENLEINISVHAGITFEDEHALEKANIALIQAKKERIDYVIYEAKKHAKKEKVNNLDTITKIKNALNNNDFKAYYQPIVDRHNNIIKYEALVRMHDDSKVISPFFFLDVAKKTKYYQYITRVMISQAFKEFEDRDLSVSINLSADDITNKDTQEFLKKQLNNFKNPSQIVFELIESEDIHEIAGIKEFISYVKEKGAKIAIDDFGTGYSNFSYLLDLEPDYLKIDGSLIKNINTDRKSFNIVKTIVNFAHGLNIVVIAEYVHSQDVLDVCKELNIDEFQGYLFGEPSLTLGEKINYS